ncbi:N-acyl-D-amino-acid deacylase family protein [Fusobacterium sp. PH5-44]|uniref:N-acyl-D-amino-acid deacylase family protein n=1 Tax=unclassified Fusobacterium TaxID=2648384 RepID=UPI003D255378
MVYDLVIENGNVVFGNLEKSQVLNIGIIKNKIVKLTNNIISGRKKIDARGKIVSPGFIDPHTHSDLSVFFKNNMSSKIAQGVTTEICGNCGVGIVPSNNNYFEQYKSFVGEHFTYPYENFPFENIKTMKLLKEFWNKDKFIINQGYLTATGCLRIAVSGFSTDKLTDSQKEKMLHLLEEELQNGSYGVSFGLIYQPGNYMCKEEIIEILKVVARYDKIASFHIRNEGANIFEAIEEVIYCGRESKCKVNISHLKIMDKDLWGESNKVLELLNKGISEGVKLTYDQYPYIATSTTLMVLIPDNIFNGDINDFLEKIDNLSIENKLEILKKINQRGGAENILITDVITDDGNYSRKFLSEIAKTGEMDVVDTLLQIIKNNHGRVKAIYFSMNDDDMYSFMNTSIGVIGSDGSSISVVPETDSGLPHPRNFATFTNFIKINRNKSFFSLEEMINKITLKTAELYSIKNRGMIKEDYFADIVVFDYDKIDGASTYNNPYKKNIGIDYVIVNGEIALEEGEVKEVRNGVFI